MCYKEGKGDPKGFKQFMKKENIKSKTIVRYVGNMMHVLFHLAGVFFSLLKQNCWSTYRNIVTTIHHSVQPSLQICPTSQFCCSLMLLDSREAANRPLDGGPLWKQ